MTQHQIGPPVRLPRCKLGHPPRLFRDHRCAAAAGGLFIECPCGRTTKHAEFDPALQEWKRANLPANPRRPAEPDTVLQFPLFAAGGRAS